MYQHILVPVDGSELSRHAISSAVALAKALNAKLTAVHAVPDYLPPLNAMVPAYPFPTPEEYEAQAAADAAEVLKDAADAAQAAGLGCELVHGIDSHPYRLIVATAKSLGCDLICMASHGRRGFTALLLGSETQKVLAHSEVPVLVVR